MARGTASAPGTVRDIIVVGASAGGVEALTTLVAGLAPGLPAAVFVVLHIGDNPSILPEILTRAGPLPAFHPSNGELIVKGEIYVAPRDRHLLIEPDHMLLSHAAKEYRARGVRLSLRPPLSGESIIFKASPTTQYSCPLYRVEPTRS